ncbi:MAG: hypothetical protein NXH95_01730 [Pseudomonadaceae bacterium]|nr:hypothetical protein [Pseudomonadaceae bacterium]
MDNKELDAILKNKFQSLQRADSDVNLVRDIMAQVETLPQVEAELPGFAPHIGRNWILLLAVLVGGVVFALSLQSFPLEQFTQLLPANLLGGYSSIATALVVPLIAVAGLLPVAWLMLED